MNNAIVIKALKKEYKDFTMNVTAIVPKGFATALIGANGAGKTTLIDTLCRVTAKTSGDAVFFENSSLPEYMQAEKTGYCSSVNYFPLSWNLKTVSRCMSIGFDNFSKERFDALCKKFELGSSYGKRQKKLIKMSDGNRVRVALAAVLARDTDLLVLDEPASSLDPLARDMLCDMFRDYLSERDGERSILFSTHNIADMESVTDYAIFMAGGIVIEQGFVEDLKNKYVLVHTDSGKAEKLKPLMTSYTENATSFEGLALAGNISISDNNMIMTERPTLQQLSVGLLRKAGHNE